MGKQDDSMFEVAEYLRKETVETGLVHPRKYEHWEITVACDHEGNWELRGKWLLRRMPMDNAVTWLLELVEQVSEDACRLPESITGEPPIALFKWKGKPRRKSDERERGDRKSE